MPRRDEHFPDPDIDLTELSPNGQEPPETRPDPFDLDRLRISDDMVTRLQVQPAVLTLRVCKPHREWFFRVHPDFTYRMQTAVIELKEDAETYLIAPELHAGLTTESAFSLRLLVTAVTKQGTPFLWPLRLPSTDGRANTWTTSAMQTAELAMTKWVRMQADRQASGYRVLVAADASEPIWPTLSFQELIRIAFKDALIETRDHIVLKRLRGEV